MIIRLIVRELIIYDINFSESLCLSVLVAGLNFATKALRL
jgi:hypothetical protein